MASRCRVTSFLWTDLSSPSLSPVGKTLKNEREKKRRKWCKEGFLVQPRIWPENRRSEVSSSDTAGNCERYLSYGVSFTGLQSLRERQRDTSKKTVWSLFRTSNVSDWLLQQLDLLPLLNFREMSEERMLPSRYVLCLRRDKRNLDRKWLFGLRLGTTSKLSCFKLTLSVNEYTNTAAVFRSFTHVKVLLPHCEDIPLQVKVCIIS